MSATFGFFSGNVSSIYPTLLSSTYAYGLPIFNEGNGIGLGVGTDQPGHFQVLPLGVCGLCFSDYLPAFTAHGNGVWVLDQKATINTPEFKALLFGSVGLEYSHILTLAHDQLEGFRGIASSNNDIGLGIFHKVFGGGGVNYLI